MHAIGSQQAHILLPVSARACLIAEVTRPGPAGDDLYGAPLTSGGARVAPTGEWESKPAPQLPTVWALTRDQ